MPLFNRPDYLKKPEDRSSATSSTSIPSSPTSGAGFSAPPIPTPIAERPSGTMGFLGSMAKGLADIALQPARFLERAGKAIGTIGLNEEQKKKVDEFMGPGLQERVGGEEYATPTYTNMKEAVGGAIQAAANLATPVVGGLGRFALQGAALAGGKVLEENKGLGEAAINAAIGGVAGAVLGKGTELLGKGLSSGFNNVVNNIGRVGRGLSEAEVGTIKAVPKIAEEYFNRLSTVGDDVVKQQQARQGIEDEIFDTARDVWSAYADKADINYASEMASHAKNLVDNPSPVDKASLVDSLIKIGDSRGAEVTLNKGKIDVNGATSEERALMEKLYNKVRSSAGEKTSVVGDLGWDQLNKLRQDIGGLYETVKPGSSERGIIDSFYNDVKNKMMSLSKDPTSVQATFDTYKQFLDEKSVFKKLTSGKSDPGAVRQGYLELSRALTGQKGTGEMSKAMAAAETAGKLKPNELAYRLQALDLASKLSGVRNVGTTERMIEGGVKNITESGIPKSVGGAVMKGLEVGSKALFDKRFMQELFKEAGIESSPTTLNQIGSILKNPKTAQILLRILQEAAQASDQ